ncbi:cupin domain-containing protein [Streptomyces sp. NPDC058385]|uniref:cupin domain-containing protein n=1 Tax=Streptomyces sp. NPDC058385 TaxID=3346473 RepID=UPI00366727AD
MEFVKQQATSKALADWFTGDVWWDVICAGQEPSRMRANLVRFAPGARTNWHSHVLGQTLHVVSGVALIGTCDGTVFAAYPGETISCPPGEEYRHGATPDRFMEHIAMWEGKGDGGR